MTSASLARDCIKVTGPLIDMIVDDDESHTGQLRYGKDIQTVQDAKDFLTKLLKNTTDACAELKSGLDSLEGKSKKVDRNSEEGILIHMTLQALRLLPDEIARLEKIDGAEKVDRYFPADLKNDRVLALVNLIKKHNGDADAESVVSLSESAYPKSTTTKAEKSAVESSISEQSSEPSPVASEEQIAEADKEASSEPSETSMSSVKEPASASETTEPAELSVVVASSEPVETPVDDEVSESLMEEASELLDEPVTPVVTVKKVDYSKMTRDDLLEAKKKFKTHKQKDAFIQDLIDSLTGVQSVVEKTPKKTETVVADVPAGAFVVEDVSKFKRSKDGVEQVLVKWKDYPIEEMTWENKTDELSRSNVGGSFFQPGDTSYKKFCERVGISTGKETCAAIEEKDKADCKKRNSKKSADEQQEDCSASSVVLIDDESESADEPEPADDAEPSASDDTATNDDMMHSVVDSSSSTNSDASAAALASSVAVSSTLSGKSEPAASSESASADVQKDAEEVGEDAAADASEAAATVESVAEDAEDEGESIIDAVEATLSE